LTHDSCCFENQDSYTHILEHSLEKISHLEKSIEVLQESALQFQKSAAQSINRMETQLSQLVRIYRNEETQSYQPLTNSAIPNSIDLTQDSYHFGNQDSILVHPSELNQTSNIENPIDILASYPFPEIELEHEYDPESQLGNSISLPDSIITEVFLPNFRIFPCQYWILCESIMILNHQSFMINKLNLTNFILLNVPLTYWQVLIFMKLTQ